MTKRKTIKKKRKPKNQHRNIKLFLGFLGIGLFIVLLVFLMASWGVFGKLPDETSLENPEKNLATEIITIDGNAG